MEPATLVTLVLSSSLLAAGLTAWMTWRVNRQNFKNDYYKKLLDKRLDACEQAEHLIQTLSGFIQMKSGALCPMVLAGGQDRWVYFLAQMLQVGSKSFWLSETTSGIITELNVFLINSVENLINADADYDQELERIGVQQAKEFRTYRERLEHSLYNDFRTLSAIPEFIRTIRPDREHKLYLPEKSNPGSGS